MIHLFNRRELLTTFSMEQQAKARNILAAIIANQRAHWLGMT